MLVHSADNTPIACASVGSGPDLLLVHGTGAPGTFWRPVRPLLAAAFTVHVMDRRGHGASGDAPGYAIEQEYQDVAACVAGLAPRPVDVVAHSFGGVCVLGACRMGARVRRLVLYEPPIPAPDAPYCDPAIIPAMRAAVAAGDTAAALGLFLTGVHNLRPEDVARLRRLASWRDQAAAAPRLLRELEAVAHAPFIAADYVDWAIPTLLLLGGDSPPQYHATAALLHAALPGSRVELLAGQSHDAVRVAPAAFAQAVQRFLQA